MKCVFVDLETTGLDPACHEIMQIAALGVVDWEIKEVFNKKLLIYEGTANPEALELAHYDRNIWLNEAIQPSAAVAHFKKFLERYVDVQCTSQAGKVFYTTRTAGYNVEFDMNFLRKLFKDHNTFCPADYRALDVLQLVLWENTMFPTPKLPDSYSLCDVCKAYGIPLDDDQVHDAMVDITATYQLAQYLRWGYE